jgi:integrase
MARPATGSVVERATKAGTSYSLRFRAHGQRRLLLLGYASEGWTRKRAEAELANVMADVRRGIWRAPEDLAPEPVECPRFHEFASAWFEAQKVEGGARGRG